MRQGLKKRVVWAAACGIATAVFAADLPRVLIIGDSISIGYTPHVKAALSNRMEVVHAPGNSAATVTGLKRLEQWIGSTPWQVIHFNFGLHDMKTIDPATTDSDMAKLVPVGKGRPWVPLDQYEANLRLLVRRLKKSGAALVWCATTPVPEGAVGRTPDGEVAYNAAALRVMRDEKVAVNDLWSFVGPPDKRLAMGGRPKDVHYTDAGSRALAGEVVKAVEVALKAGWIELFDGRSLAGWRPYGKPSGTPAGEGWQVEGGLLHKRPGIRGGDIITERIFNDFELEWEWRLAKDANNGVKYCVTEKRPGAPGYEYQMLDDSSPRFQNLPAKSLTASFYEVLAPAADKPLKPAGEWNLSRVVVRGERVEHWLNGRNVLEYTFGSEAVKAGVADSKFKKYPDFGSKCPGHIMLTDHQDEAWYRRISLRELNGK
jgi:acyl-CoA thioesterase-1